MSIEQALLIILYLALFIASVFLLSRYRTKTPKILLIGKQGSGKTRLVEALSGHNRPSFTTLSTTERPLTLPNKTQVILIDSPGHERLQWQLRAIKSTPILLCLHDKENAQQALKDAQTQGKVIGVVSWSHDKANLAVPFITGSQTEITTQTLKLLTHIR